MKSLPRSLARSLSLVSVGAVVGCAAPDVGVTVHGTVDGDGSAEGFVVWGEFMLPTDACRSDVSVDDESCLRVFNNPAGDGAGAQPDGRPRGVLSGDFPATWERTFEVPSANSRFAFDNADGSVGEVAYGFIFVSKFDSEAVFLDDVDGGAAFGVADARMIFTQDVEAETLAAWGLNDGINFVTVGDDGAYSAVDVDADLALSATSTLADAQLLWSESALLRHTPGLRAPEQTTDL